MTSRSFPIRRWRFVVAAVFMTAVGLAVAFAPADIGATQANARYDRQPEVGYRTTEGGHWMRYGLTGTNLQDVDLVAPDDAWAVGTDGVLAHWDGQDWQVYDDLALGTRDINEIEMLASDRAWAAANGGRMLKYDGISWAFESSNILTSTMQSLSMVSPTEGWAGGEGGIFAHYTGTTWAQVAPAPGITSTIWGLSMVIPNNGTMIPTDGWAVTGASDQSGRIGKILRFDGTSWQQYPFTTDRPLYDVDMLDSTYGWAVGSYGLMIEWKDGAWTQVSSPTGGTLVKVCVYSRTDAWAASVDGSLAHWDGTQWTGVGSLTPAGLWAVCMLSPDMAWAVGDAGTIYKYDGSQWTVVESSQNMKSLYSLDFVNPNDGWASGTADNWGEPGMWHWDGTWWTGYPIPVLFERLEDVDMAATDAAWAAGWYGHVLHWNGTAWLTDTIPPDSYFNAISMVSPTDGWAVGRSPGGYTARVLHYNGTAWDYAAYPHAQGWTSTCIDAVDTNDVWMGGWIDTSTGVLVHYDGATWEEIITTAPIQAIDMVNANEGWAVGGNDTWSLVLHYLNGTWTPVDIGYPGGLFDVHMLDREDGWMVGRYVFDPVPEAFFHYDGSTWTRFASPTGNVVTGIRTVDATHAWAVSEGNYGYGGLLYFESSPVSPTPTPTATSTPVVPPTLTPTTTPTATATPPCCCAINFSDVRTTDYFYEPVLYLYCHGAISGYSDGTFRPYNNTTRGQLAKMAVLAEGWQIDTDGSPHFIDVPQNHPFYAYVETAFNRGVISGYDDGTFRPMNNVTRGQLTKIMVVAEGWQIDTGGGPHFTDVAPGGPFYGYVETAFNHGIISGYSDGTFRPGNSATRGQIAKNIYLAITRP